MTVEVEPGPPIAEADVAGLERRNRLELPDGYRRFLLASNGGEPDLNEIIQDDLDVTVREFYSIGTGDTSDIQWAIDSTGPFPDDFLPIGHEDGGNSYLLALAGADRGSVWYWDHEHELDQPDPEHPGLGPATKVAPTFEAFLAMLQPV